MQTHFKKSLFIIIAFCAAFTGFAQVPQNNIEKDLRNFRWQSSTYIPDTDILSQQRIFMTICLTSDSCNTPAMWIEDNNFLIMQSDSSILSYKYIYVDRTRILTIWINSHNQLAYEVTYGSTGYSFSLRRKYDVDKIKWPKRFK